MNEATRSYKTDSKKRKKPLNKSSKKSEYGINTYENILCTVSNT